MSLKLKEVCYKYNPGTTYEVDALKNINLTIGDGEFIGLIGHTGSGKSTLIQHLNGLLSATSGTIFFNNENIYDKEFDRRALRTKVGMVFQYPEHQLFETTVFEDVKFGPKNQGLEEKEVTLRAYQALKAVGFPDELYDQSPFELSGGQKRRVAIAGVIAMQPEVLVLDEPTAGLDPKGRDEMFALIKDMHDTTKNTVILVSHSMEDVARYVERLIVIDEGQIQFDDTPRNVFSHYKRLEEMGLAAPRVTYLMHALREQGLPVDPLVTTVEEAKREILAALGKQS